MLLTSDLCTCLTNENIKRMLFPNKNDNEDQTDKFVIQKIDLYCFILFFILFDSFLCFNDIQFIINNTLYFNRFMNNNENKKSQIVLSLLIRYQV